jgi:hypothetical protein
VEQIPAFTKRIASLREAEVHQDTLRKQLKDTQDLIEQPATDGKAPADWHAQANVLERKSPGCSTNTG